MDFEQFAKGATVRPTSGIAKLAERVDFFGYHFVRDSFVPFIEFARAHGEDVDSTQLHLAFANSLKRTFADPSGGIKCSPATIKLVPKAMDYLKRHYGVARLPANIIHTINLM